MRYLHIAILWWLKRLHGDRRWVSYFSPFICLQISCTSAQPWYYLECMWCSKIRIKYIWKGTRYVFAMMSCSKNKIIFVIHFCHHFHLQCIIFISLEKRVFYDGVPASHSSWVTIWPTGLKDHTGNRITEYTQFRFRELPTCKISNVENVQI